jgi:methionyl-tRNA synthetase
MKGSLEKLEWNAFAEGSHIAKGDVLFPRIDLDAWKEEKAQRELKKSFMPDPGEHEEQIRIDDFKKIEMRVAQVISAEPVPKADKLFKLELDLGYEHRTIVSGIREYYKPEEMVGKKIIVICNLKPAKLRGVESNGMLMAAESCTDDGLALLTVDQDIPVGSKIH